MMRARINFRGGDDGIRTHDPHVANVMLSQLSYIPTGYMRLRARTYFAGIGSDCQMMVQNVHRMIVELWLRLISINQQ